MDYVKPERNKMTYEKSLKGIDVSWEKDEKPVHYNNRYVSVRYSFMKECDKKLHQKETDWHSIYQWISSIP